MSDHMHWVLCRTRLLQKLEVVVGIVHRWCHYLCWYWRIFRHHLHCFRGTTDLRLLRCGRWQILLSEMKFIRQANMKVELQVEHSLMVQVPLFQERFEPPTSQHWFLLNNLNVSFYFLNKNSLRISNLSPCSNGRSVSRSPLNLNAPTTTSIIGFL